MAVVLLSAAACSDDDAPIAPPVLTNVTIRVASPTLEVGEMTTAFAVGLDQDGDTIATAAPTWDSETPGVAGINPATGMILAIGPGTTRIKATIDGKVGEQMLTVATAPAIRINEVQPRGDAPTGWLELTNASNAPVDLGGWTMVDANFFGPIYRFANGTIVQPGGFLIIEESTLPFGVDANDALHLFSKFGVQVDQAGWAGEIPTTLGRCPDGTGGFKLTNAPTKGTANSCPAN